MAAQALMKRGKRSVAKYIKDECQRQSGQQLLNELIDHVLDPDKSLEDFEALDWCRWVIAGGMTYDEFAKEVSRYDNAITCGLVWTTNFVAYRCRTCCISPCMSLCADCFQAGNHTGHDFNMFRSQAGGACDCGDSAVMKPVGFCPRHGPNQMKRQMSVPPGLLSVAEVMMPRLIFRLIQHLRDNSKPEMLDTFVVAMKDAENYLNFLHSLSDMGAAMREVITRAVTNPQVYANLTQNAKTESQFNYSAALDSLKGPKVADEFRNVKGLDAPLKHTTMLEELIFWMLKFEFPQKVVTLLLSILPNDNYKEAFTRAFVQHYSRISIALVNSPERQQISHRVVHISIQLFSPEYLACKMVDEYNLLYIILTSLKHMFADILTASDLNDFESNFHYVVDCGKDALREHCYWPIISDLINILSHKPIAYRFMADAKLLQSWFELVSSFQGMNLNQREAVQHVEYEPDTYYAAFSAELEICSSPMWLLLVHCNSVDTRQHTKLVVRTVNSSLRDWFNAIDTHPMSKPNSYQASFHLPLHRYLAVFVAQAVKLQGMELTQLLPTHDLLQMLLIHPLQLQVVFYEIFCGMWVRNGLQIKGQAMTYIQCHFCNSMVDADLYLLQVCATRLCPDFLIRTILERFHVLDVLTFVPADKRKPGYLERQHEVAMLEGTLTLLTMLLCIRTNLGMSEDELTRLEMITLLCMNDRTHSQLTDLMPEKCGLTGQAKDFEPTLKQVSEYKAPNFEAGGTMQQGMYVPKDEIWRKGYDPLYASLRAMHRRDFQQSMDRYTSHVRQRGLYSGSGSPWPPFRIPSPAHSEYANISRLLHCRTMHGLIFTLLYKALNDPQTSDAVAYYTVYLLELAISIPSNSDYNRECKIPNTTQDKQFSYWFSSDVILTNVRKVITEVAAIVEEVVPPVSSSSSTSETSSTISSDSSPEGLVTQDITPLPVSFQIAPSIVTASSPSLTPIVGTTISADGGTVEIGLPAIMDTMVSVPETVPPAPSNTTSITPSQVIPVDTGDIINAVQALLEEATAQVANPTTSAPGRASLLSSGVRNQGCSAQMDKRHVSINIPVNESILTLLLKLHSKLAGKPNSYIPESQRSVPTSSAEDDSRIGDGVFFIGKVLDKICRLSATNADIVSEYYHRNLPKGSKAGKPEILDKEERRKRAQERQRRLLEQYASKQKEFMEKLMHDQSQEDGADGGEEEDMDSGSTDETTPMREDIKFDCVICNQTTPSTSKRPIGLVALLQSTSVLAHRRHTDEPLILPTSENAQLQPVDNCASDVDKRLKLLMKHFNEDSVLQSVNIGWEGGVYAQTCGHYVHFDCHTSYMESLTSTQLQVDKGEYWCPLCRQLANTALPICPSESAAITRPYPTADLELVKHISDLIRNQPITRGSQALTQGMGTVMENLSNIAYPKFKSYSKTHSTENILSFVCSIARVNLEMEVLVRGGSPCLHPPGAAKRDCFLPLVQVLSMHSKLLTMKTLAPLWSHVSGVPADSAECSDLQIYQEEVPLLLKDASAVLIQLILNMPYTMHKAEFQCLVRVVYNMVYVQALTIMSCKFSDEERDAWQGKVSAKHAVMDLTSLEHLLGYMIQCLRGSSIYEDGSPVDPHIPAICQSVWTTLSVEQSVQEFCMNFVRLAALLQHHLFSDDLPVMTDFDQSREYQKLSQFLNLQPTPEIPVTQRPTSCSSAPGHQVADSTGKTGVHWFCEKPELLLKAWCRHLVQFANKQAVVARVLLIKNPIWCRPQLYTLPTQYDKIFQRYRKKQCPNCSSVPRDPAICLICGTLLCFKDTCCHSMMFECVQHSIDCGGGTAMYLIVNSSLVVVIRGTRATIWGSVYLDEHGEEDRELKRGKPLYLSEERYRLLYNQWISHSFDHSCKRWIFHQNRI